MTTIEKAISKYGADAQLNVAIEEFAELTKEICKHKRYADNRANIIEEMADCYIMLDQLSIIFGITFSEIDKVKDKKIARLEMRLAEGSNQ
jgi:NTP pyrophosphatase (non-canonical NTP hydrolase)